MIDQAKAKRRWTEKEIPAQENAFSSEQKDALRQPPLFHLSTRAALVSHVLHMEIYTPVHMDCMCYASGCNLHGGYNKMLSMVYLGRALKLMQNGLRTTGIGYNTVKMRFMCM